MEKKVRWIILQMLFGVFENVLAVLLTCINANMIDSVITKDITSFVKSITFVMIVLVLQIIFLYLENLFCVKIKSEYGCYIRTSIYTNIMKRIKQNDINKASILNIYNTYLGQEQEYIGRIADIGISIIALLVASFVMVGMNTKLYFSSLILIPLSGYLYQIINKPLQEKNKEIIKRKENINRDIKQIVDGFYIIKAYLLEKNFGENFSINAELLKKNEKEKDKINSGLGRIGIVLRYIPQLIIPLYGGWLCMQKELTVGELSAINTVIWYVISPIENLLDIYKNKKLLEPIREEIENLLIVDTDDGKIDSAYKLVKKNESYMIEIQNVSFSYLKKNSILCNLNLCIEKGTHIVLMGESGCGKSTIAKILCGFQMEYEGTVRLDGIDLKEETISLLQKKIAYVPQEPYIYSGSIKENICMGKVIPEKKLWQAIELSGVLDFIKGFSDGIEALVGEGGINLSGGQIKKIAVARALVEEVPIYILDEPLAALDENGVEKIQENLSEFLKEKTVIIITHQPLTFWRGIDEIYWLEKGTVRNEKPAVL